MERLKFRDHKYVTLMNENSDGVRISVYVDCANANTNALYRLRDNVKFQPN